jgi:hypothetical protein
MHQIAKINHCETSILGGKRIAVKLMACLCQTVLSSLQKINEFFPRESRFPQKRQESALRYVTVVFRHHGSTSEDGMVVNEVAARCVVEHEAVAN